MALTSKELNSMMVDKFTFIVALNPDNPRMANIREKMQRHFLYVQTIYAGCNQPGNGKKGAASG